MYLFMDITMYLLYDVKYITMYLLCGQYNVHIFFTFLQLFCVFVLFIFEKGLEITNSFCIFTQMSIMSDIWKDIDGYEGLYQASNTGKIRSLDRIMLNRWGNGERHKRGKLMKFDLTSNGYLAVNLSKDGIRKRFLVHRIVAQCFIPNPENKPCIDHINTNRLDNRIENLRWVTRIENQNNSITKSKMKLNKSKSKPILQLTPFGELVKKWDSASEAGRKLNIYSTSISNCCRNRKHYNTAYGYKWVFEKDYERIPFKVFDLEIYKKIS